MNDTSSPSNGTDHELLSPLDAGSQSIIFPKPPSQVHDDAEESQASVPNAPPLADPPPPYPTPSRDRRLRAGTTRSARRLAQLSGDAISVASVADTDTLSPNEDGVETTPLLSPHRRPRTVSHSTILSTQSMAHTVMSIFQADDDDTDPLRIGDENESTNANAALSRGWRRYFRPMRKSSYYWPIVHLLFINFPYALLAFVYLFVGTLTGTALLIALPIGVVLCWFNLWGARAFARGEIFLQCRFHGPLAIQPPDPPNPIFARRRINVSSLESGLQTEPQTFLKNTYDMFMDQTSYQAIFYFLVIKPSVTLFLTVVLLVVVPVAFALILPAPAVLRAVKRVGNWQANLAIEGLSRPRL
ncbi:hypothetical protein SCHPADRAFT_826688 [Schizopora paradoxa]|uniref:Uncharacterized protein n=1 Tax=Schizopora paradoxa TaxID=27342 RepID=A0A0H2RXM8_9AGAM|nr:hypothetical protein SCHPADRAFT_826688 [Schizopora paradoxa]